MRPSTLDEIHQFWFGPLPQFQSFNEDRLSLWFGGTRDDEITSRFLADLEEADKAKVDVKTLTPARQVGLVVLFDQFPRSIYRGNRRCYDYDEKARAAAKLAIAGGLADFKLVERAFLTICLAHSESVEDQEQASACFDRDVAPYAPADNRFYEAGRIQTAKYLGIIRRFGRFPHRNEVLGRKSSDEEVRFMAETRMAPF